MLRTLAEFGFSNVRYLMQGRALRAQAALTIDKSGIQHFSTRMRPNSAIAARWTQKNASRRLVASGLSRPSLRTLDECLSASYPAIASSRSYFAVPRRTIDGDAAEGELLPADLFSGAATDAATSTSPELMQAAMQIGDLKSMGLVHYTPVGAIQAALEAVYVTTGLPWWAAIAATTILMRGALVPLVAAMTRNNARMFNVTHIYTPLMEKLSAAKTSGDHELVKKLTHDVHMLTLRGQFSPLRSALLPLIQAPFMVSFFMALRKMAEVKVPSMTTGGMAWFTDLTVPDPYYILPVVSSAAFLAILEAGNEAGTATVQTQNMKNMSRALVAFFLANNIFSIGQILTLKLPLVKQYFNIPEREPLALEYAQQKQAMQKKESANMKTFDYLMKPAYDLYEQTVEVKKQQAIENDRKAKIAIAAMVERKKKEDDWKKREAARGTMNQFPTRRETMNQLPTRRETMKQLPTRRGQKLIDAK